MARSRPGTVGGETAAMLIRQAREDDDVKAIVLRVDSPGGSVFASEQIYREVRAARAAGKPVVVSMGDLAASGGYYIASSADEIWAHPATITGSIGIFGAIPTFQNTLNKIGVSVDGVGTTKLSGQLAPRPPARRRRQVLLQSFIERGYEEFLAHVAEGRKKTRDEVHAIAQGRVWIGTDAKSNWSRRSSRPVRPGGEVRGKARRTSRSDYEVERIESPSCPGPRRSRCRSRSGSRRTSWVTSRRAFPQLQVARELEPVAARAHALVAHELARQSLRLLLLRRPLRPGREARQASRGSAGWLILISWLPRPSPAFQSDPPRLLCIPARRGLSRSSRFEGVRQHTVLWVPAEPSPRSIRIRRSAG